jgi:hypothetical protein
VCNISSCFYCNFLRNTCPDTPVVNSYQKSLDTEIDQPRKTFRQNGYSSRDIKRSLATKQKSQIQKEKSTRVALIPFQKAVLNKINRLLAKYNIKTIHIPVKKNTHMLRPKKGKLGLKSQVYTVVTSYLGS